MKASIQRRVLQSKRPECNELCRLPNKTKHRSSLNHVIRFLILEHEQDAVISNYVYPDGYFVNWFLQPLQQEDRRTNKKTLNNEGYTPSIE